jgi:ubiquinone/menaquinone biosynthesis C-methylase UbiE
MKLSSDLRDYLETIRSYNSIAKGYRFWRAKPWPITRVVKGKVILDAGSGPCINGAEAATRNNAYVICLDISTTMLLEAKEILIKRGVLGDAIAADATKMPLRSSSIDAVMAVALIHHLPKPLAEMFFREVYRVLKPRGILVATVWLWRQRRFALQTVLNYLRTLGGLLGYPRKYTVLWRTRRGNYRRVYYLYTEKELAELAEKASLKVLSLGYTYYLKHENRNLYLIALKA